MAEMSNEQKGCLGCGFIIACIVVISLLAQAAKAYYENVSTGNVILGVFIGMASGIAVGAVFGGLGESVSKKSMLGPLPTLKYLRSWLWLQRKYEVPEDAILLEDESRRNHH